MVAANVCNDCERENKTFSDVLTVKQIRQKYTVRYAPSQVQEVLLFLEKSGQTISDAQTTKNGRKTQYFYFDNNVKEKLLKELEKRGYRPTKLRIRYDIPTYVKFYSVYQYDRDKFRKLLNEWLKTQEGINRTYDVLLQRQREFLEQCWVLDEYNNKKRDCDELHIFRYRTLHRILECIANCLINKYGIKTGAMAKYLHARTNIAIYPFSDGMKPEAELLNTIMYDIKTRIIMHLRLLKGLKKGLEIEDAVALAHKCPVGF